MDARYFYDSLRVHAADIGGQGERGGSADKQASTGRG